jgi:hypothetical protein
MNDYPQWENTAGAAKIPAPPASLLAVLMLGVLLACWLIFAPQGCYMNGTHFGRVAGLSKGEYVKQTTWHDDGSATVTIAGPDGERSFRQSPVNGIYYSVRGHPDDPNHIDDFDPPVIIFLP